MSCFLSCKVTSLTNFIFISYKLSDTFKCRAKEGDMTGLREFEENIIGSIGWEEYVVLRLFKRDKSQ